MTSAERITLPGFRCGASPPATPKLTRHLACCAASSTSASVRPGSPPPTMTWNPAARATLASAARPEVQSTGINVRMRSPPSLRESGWMVGVPPQPTSCPRPQARGHNGSARFAHARQRLCCQTARCIPTATRILLASKKSRGAANRREVFSRCGSAATEHSRRKSRGPAAGFRARRIQPAGAPLTYRPKATRGEFATDSRR